MQKMFFHLHLKLFENEEDHVNNNCIIGNKIIIFSTYTNRISKAWFFMQSIWVCLCNYTSGFSFKILFDNLKIYFHNF